MDELDNLYYYKLVCTVDLSLYTEKGYIASELEYDTIHRRLKNSPKVKSFELERVERDKVEFPVTLIGINQKYHSWEDLAKDYLISKIAGIE